jgi:hypothetical protein
MPDRLYFTESKAVKRAHKQESKQARPAAS